VHVRCRDGHILSCCKQTEGGEEEGSVDLRFAHAVGGSCAVLPFAACLLRVGSAVVCVETISGWQDRLRALLRAELGTRVG
jgi:hypothetical protein